MAKRHAVSKKDAALQIRLGALVKSYRERLGITQEELAWRADMHRTYVADIERGGRNVTLRSIVGLAVALQIPVQSLFSSAGGSDAVGEILLVEDNEADVALTLRAFERAKFNNPIRVLRDGLEAIEYLHAQGRYAGRPVSVMPQLVLLDLGLPKLSGLEVLQRLKSHERTRSIPVVILTASVSDRHMHECALLGAENYIIKPVSFAGLCNVTPKLSLGWALVKPAEDEASAAGSARRPARSPDQGRRQPKEPRRAAGGKRRIH